MCAAFVYQPHVHSPDGDVITPDLLVEEVRFLTGRDARTIPAGLMSSASSAQRVKTDPGIQGTCVLVGATYGALVAPGLLLGKSAFIGRQAWRLDDVLDRWASGFLLVTADGNSSGRPTSRSLPSLNPVQAMFDGKMSVPAGTAIHVGDATSVPLPNANPVRLKVVVEIPSAGRLPFHLYLQSTVSD